MLFFICHWASDDQVSINPGFIVGHFDSSICLFSFGFVSSHRILSESELCRNAGQNRMQCILKNGICMKVIRLALRLSPLTEKNIFNSENKYMSIFLLKLS